MYSKTILDRFQNPRHAGSMHGANASGQAGGTNGEDLMKMYFVISNKETIENAKFKTFGCCVSIASLDVACDLLTGKSLENAMEISNRDLEKVLGEVPAHKKVCLDLTVDCIRATINDYYAKKEKEIKKAKRKASL